MKWWFHVTHAQRHSRDKRVLAMLSGIAGVYAVYGDGKLAYIGYSQNIAKRIAFSGHFKAMWGPPRHGIPHPYSTITMKFRPDRFLSEGKKLELKLIRRLQPLRNVTCTAAAKKILGRNP